MDSESLKFGTCAHRVGYFFPHRIVVLVVAVVVADYSLSVPWICLTRDASWNRLHKSSGLVSGMAMAGKGERERKHFSCTQFFPFSLSLHQVLSSISFSKRKSFFFP